MRFLKTFLAESIDRIFYLVTSLRQSMNAIFVSLMSLERIATVSMFSTRLMMSWSGVEVRYFELLSVHYSPLFSPLLKRWQRRIFSRPLWKSLPPEFVADSFMRMISFCSLFSLNVSSSNWLRVVFPSSLFCTLFVNISSNAPSVKVSASITSLSYSIVRFG